MELEKLLESELNLLEKSNLLSSSPNHKTQFDNQIENMLNNNIVLPLLHLEAMNYSFLPHHQKQLYSKIFDIAYVNSEQLFLFMNENSIPFSTNIIDLLFDFNPSYKNSSLSYNKYSQKLSKPDCPSLNSLSPNLKFLKQKFPFLYENLQLNSSYIYQNSISQLDSLLLSSQKVSNSFWSKTFFKNFYLSKKIKPVQLHCLFMIHKNLSLSHPQIFEINQKLFQIIQNFQPFENNNSNSYFNLYIKNNILSLKNKFETLLSQKIDSNDSVFSTLIDYTKSIQSFFKNNKIISKPNEKINPLHSKYFQTVTKYREIKHLLDSNHQLHNLVEHKLLSAFQEYKKIENVNISKNNKTPSDLFSEAIDNVQFIIDKEISDNFHNSINILNHTNNVLKQYKH